MPVIDARVLKVERLPLAQWPDAIRALGLDEPSTQYLRDRYRIRQDTRGMARRTDPVTSHEAAARVVASGSRADHVSRIVTAVRRRPGRTSAELARDTGLERHEAARRTSDAERAGLIRKGLDARRCSISGRKAVTWHPALDASQVRCVTGEVA